MVVVGRDSIAMFEVERLVYTLATQSLIHSGHTRSSIVLAPIVLTIYIASCMRKMSNKKEIILCCYCCSMVVATIDGDCGKTAQCGGNNGRGLFWDNVKSR